MNPTTTTVAELLEHCLKMMASGDTDTLELDFGTDETTFTFEIKVIAMNGKPATEYKE